MSCKKGKKSTSSLFESTIQVGSRWVTLMVSADDERTAAKLMVEALADDIKDQEEAFGDDENPYTASKLYKDLLVKMMKMDSRNYVGPGAIITKRERIKG